MPPATIGRYQVRSVLGEGGFGSVYRAADPVLDRELAVKVLHAQQARDPEIRARFLREGRALASLHHPNLVAVYDAGEADGLTYLAMELVSGRPLPELGSGGAPPLATLLPLLEQVAAALEAVHAAGLVHRDVKPANILVTSEGRAVLLDLGLAHIAGAGLTRAGTILGTPGFLAPEQVDGAAVGPRTDVYGLAATAFALLAGRPPFEGSLPRVLATVLRDPAPDLAALRPDLPPVVAAVLGQALAKSPADRPATPMALIGALQRAVNPTARASRSVAGVGVPSAAASTSGAGAVRRTVRRLWPGRGPHARGSRAPAGEHPPQSPPRAYPPAAPADTPTEVAAPPPAPEAATEIADGAEHLATRRTRANLRTPDPAGTRPSPRAREPEPGPPAPSAPAGAGRPRRPWLLLGAGVLGALLLAASAWLVVRDGGEVESATPFSGAPSPSAVAGGLPASSPSPAPLLTVGSVVPLTASQEFIARACGGREIPAILAVRSIELEPTGRVNVEYTRSIPRIPGLECEIPFLPDAGSGSITLQTLEGDREFSYPSIGGRGLATSGSPNIYGRQADGTWVFDRVNPNVSRIDLVELASDGREIYRLRLLPK